MRLTHMFSWLSILLIGCIVTTESHATIVKVRFSGIVTTVGDVDRFPIGARMFGVIAYDTNTPASDDSIPTQTFYPNSIVSISLNIGNEKFTLSADPLNPSNNNTSVVNNQPIPDLIDQLFFGAPLSGTPDAQNLIPFFFGLIISDDTATVFDSGELPLAPSTDDLASPTNRWTVFLAPDVATAFDGNGDLRAIRGELTSLSPVPIPAAIWFLLSGFGLFVSLSRRKRRNLDR